MKKFIISIFLLLFCLAPDASAREVADIKTGGISMKLTLPEGFNPETDRCPMVILMHGIFASKDFIPMPSLAKGLAREGIASIRFDFNGHGSEDSIVPLWCSEKYLETYGDNAELKVIDGENHMITKKRKQIVAETVAFFKKLFSN